MNTNWENHIRTSYKGILSDEQIEATVKYWHGIIQALLKEQLEKVRESIEIGIHWQQVVTPDDMNTALIPVNKVYEIIDRRLSLLSDKS